MFDRIKDLQYKLSEKYK